MYSTRWAFLAGIAIFEIESLVCGFSPTSSTPIVDRSISGLGAGSINAGAVVMLPTPSP
ncbi:hypothetical protein BO71DRAFT_401120 [Aspergillus ellipticus CBS 707.79]|uniref:Major facilitator superfamily (MFS) profile domain-containing protein n=1 Tax=Aspergillus ellipticus CBS 707.79 TaxID=1448320 RepID=A0A319ELB1_9EURO|nr:hypothetical protein BO71DRAFT_401120 [Aspergillus ellipticus CBS 707.79]